MWTEFKGFLLKQNALALAVAVVIGAALNKVVTAIVDDFIMPIINAVTPGGDWMKWVFPTSGPVQFKIGDFLGAILNFVIIGFVAWRLSKLVPSAPDAPVKECPYCRSSIDPRATKCSHCTSAVA